jgi:hypothetical protein
MNARKNIAVACGVSVIVVVAYFAMCYLVPYCEGRSRAQNDLTYQSFSFPKGHGYRPASRFSDGVAHLYVGYPQDDWVAGTKLSQRYIDCWISGYKSVVEKAGYTLQRTRERPVDLGMKNPEQDAAADAGKPRR